MEMILLIVARLLDPFSKRKVASVVVRTLRRFHTRPHTHTRVVCVCGGVCERPLIRAGQLIALCVLQSKRHACTKARAQILV